MCVNKKGMWVNVNHVIDTCKCMMYLHIQTYKNKSCSSAIENNLLV